MTLRSRHWLFAGALDSWSNELHCPVSERSVTSAEERKKMGGKVNLVEIECHIMNELSNEDLELSCVSGMYVPHPAYQLKSNSRGTILGMYVNKC